MKIRFLELRNYRRHRHTKLEWPDGVIAVLGRNGSGKSTLLEAIGFALFGVPATRTGKDLLKWEGAGPMDGVAVTIEFELNGEALRLHRELKGKALTPSAVMTVDGKVAVDPGAGSNEAVTSAIEAKLGMDRDTFFTTVVAQQKDLDRLGTMKPVKRKQMLLSMLGVDELDSAIEAARANRKSAEDKLQALRDVAASPDELREKKRKADDAVAEAKTILASATEQWAQAKEKLTTGQATLDAAQELANQWANQKAQLTQAETAAAQAKLQQTTIAKQLEEAALAKTEFDGAEARAAGYADLQQQVASAKAATAKHEQFARDSAAIEMAEKELQTIAKHRPLEQIHKLQAKAAADQVAGQEKLIVAKTQLTAAQNHLSSTSSLGKDAPCPTCQRPMQEHLPKLQEELQQQVERGTAEVAALSDAAKNFAQAVAALELEAKAANRAHELKAEITQLKSQLGPEPKSIDLAVLEKQLADAKAAYELRLRRQRLIDQIPRMEKELGVAKKAGADADKAVVSAKEALAKIATAPEKLAAAQKSMAECNSKERAAERAALTAQHANQLATQQLNNVKARIDEAKQAAKTRTKLEEDAQYWAALASGRGKGMLEAFKAHLVGRIGPAIGREASRLLSKFTGGRYNEVTLDAEYNVFISDHGVNYTLERFSGGEADLVHLAMRLAVSRLLIERSNADLRFLALDEVFGSLDDERRQTVLMALQELGSLYSQVVLVTHHDSLRDALDASLLVEERDGEAVVSLHGG